MKTNKILLSIMILIAHNFYGQSLSALVKEAESLFEKTRNKLVFPKTSEFNVVEHFYTSIDTLKNVTLLQSELKLFESKQYSKDIGLVFKAHAQYNFRNIYNEATNNFSIGRICTELEWNILQSGYIYNRTKAKRLKNEMEMLENNKIQSERALMRRQFRIDYSYLINLEGIQHFQKFLEFENKYFDFLNKLYFKKYIKRERLIKVSHQINLLKNQVKTLQKQNQILKDSVSLVHRNNKILPFLELKLDSLSYAYNSKNLTLQKENISLQHKAINDLNFSFYVQENFNYSKNGHRFFPSVGIRFRAPIRFNHRKKVVETKMKILTAQNIDKSVGKYNRIITLVSGYNEKLKDVQNQHKSWEYIEERIRILSVLKSELNNEETGVLLLELMEEEFRVLENMLQLKRQLYTTLSHVFEVTEVIDIKDLITPINFEAYKGKRFFAIKQSKMFNLKFQIAFLKAKGCLKVEVLENDITTQKALHKAKIKFQKVQKLEKSLVEFAINREINQINI